MDNLEFQVLKWRWNKVRARYRTGLDPLGPPLPSVTVPVCLSLPVTVRLLVLVIKKGRPKNEQAPKSLLPDQSGYPTGPGASESK